jgi:hypothetical protein
MSTEPTDADFIEAAEKLVARCNRMRVEKMLCVLLCIGVGDGSLGCLILLVLLGYLYGKRWQKIKATETLLAHLRQPGYFRRTRHLV